MLKMKSSNKTFSPRRNNSATPRESRNYILCPQCHSRILELIQIVPKASDEVPTTICACINCGHTWRLYV